MNENVRIKANPNVRVKGTTVFQPLCSWSWMSSEDAFQIQFLTLDQFDDLLHVSSSSTQNGRDSNSKLFLT